MIKQKGLENVTVDDLVAEITPTGRGEVWVPTTLRWVVGRLSNEFDIRVGWGEGTSRCLIPSVPSE